MPKPSEEQVLSGWDEGLDFAEQKTRLEQSVITTRNQVLKAKWAILLIQLVNGSRIGEAVAAALEYAEHSKREVRVRAEKRQDNYMRLMIIPKVVRRYPDLKEVILGLNAAYGLTHVMVDFARRRGGFRSHGQRYAFITDVSDKEDRPAEFIAKMTGQKDAKVVIRYISQKKAEQALRERVN